MEIDAIKQKVLEDVDPKLKEEKKRERRKDRLIIFLEFLVLIGLILFLFYLMMGISTVDGNSMYPTLHDQDVVVYNRRGSTYKAGDVVAVKMPGKKEYVKRVVAVAGDTVNIQSGKLYVNGEEVETNGSIGETKREGSEVEYPLKVKDKEYFVLGDNRENSEDSRSFGSVSVSDIKGKLMWYIGRL